MSGSIHVVPHDDKWAARREHSERVSRQFDTQKDAIDYARQVARTEHLELVIHRPDGTIRDKDSYGNDPYPPPG
jgi:uncharacterized protein YdaT